MGVVIERYDSRSRDKESYEMLFHVRSALSEEEARAELALLTPVRYLNLWRQDIHAEPNKSGRAGLYDCTVSYGTEQPKEPEKVYFSFSTAGGSQKITQSITTREKYVAEGEEAEDYEGAIGVTEDSIEGVEIEASSIKLILKKYVPIEEVTADFIKELRSRTKTYNEQPWRGFAAGEVRLVTVDGEPYDADLAELKFEFLVEENREDVTIGKITGIAKDGWDYLWVAYETVKGGKRLKQTPRQVNVEQVYYPSNFSDLGLED